MKISRWFLYSAALVLLLAAAAKIVSSAGSAKILLHYDPLTGFRFESLFRIVGGIEVMVALVCLFCKRTWLPAGLVAWLATSIAAYRLGLIWIRYQRPCNCLGNLTDGLHIPPHAADTAMEIILAYLLIGSYMTLIWLWRQKWKTPSALASSDASVLPV